MSVQNNIINNIIKVNDNPLSLPNDNEWKQILDIGTKAFRSGLLPNSIKSPEAAAIIALKARELGLPIMTGFSHIIVVNGKPAMSAELMQAQARKNLPGLVLNVLKTDDKECIVEGQRPERGQKPIKVTFTIEHAKRAGLLNKDVWKQYPEAMLRSRATTALLRILCPDALMGVSYTPEELGVDPSMDKDAIETSSRPVEETPITEEPKPDLTKPIDWASVKNRRDFFSSITNQNSIKNKDVIDYMLKNCGTRNLDELNEIQLNEVVAFIKNFHTKKPDITVEPKLEPAPIQTSEKPTIEEDTPPWDQTFDSVAIPAV